MDPERKADLRRYLQDARTALLWKLDGLSEYDIRRPLVPTGTNLLGLVKHATFVETSYFGDTFGRSFPDPVQWDPSDPNSDMFATPDESRDQITDRYRRVWAHSDATIEAFDLDATANVPWWPAERNPVTLHHLLVRLVAETSRHAGHADIIRELIDGAAGLAPGQSSLPSGDQARWAAHYERVEQAARTASGAPPPSARPTMIQYSQPIKQEATMRLSARNQIPAKVTGITTGEATANVELDANGIRLVASITVEATRDLGLEVGSDVVAVIKASEVILAVND